MDRDFTVARGVIGLIEVIGWIAVVFGVITVVLGLTNWDFASFLVIGVAMSASGLVQIAVVQIARAQIVTAENSGEMVALLRGIAKNGEVANGTGASRSKGATTRPTGRTSDGNFVVHDPGEVGVVVKRYKGQPIVRAPEGFSVDGEGSFPTLLAAEKFIDRIT